MSHGERWAVLIGINFYSESNSGPSNLEGCINDVNDTKIFLQSHLDIQTDHITVLVADQDSSRSQQDWPTRSNVMKAISMVKERAQPGDFLYIHYSGHGDRVFVEDREGSDDTRCYEVLCTLEEEIKDADFGGLLDALIDDGLNICVVLDCCYAGGASRHGSQTKVRCKTEIPKQPSKRDDTRDEVRGILRSQRNAVHRKGLLYRPRGYNLIAACQPFQPAVEWRSGNGKVNGALTFHLLQSLLSLQASTGPITYRMLQDVLEAKCKDLRQQPMHMGDDSRILFQAAKYTANLSNTVTTVERVKGTNIMLRKGAAHSIHIGDKFKVHHPSQYSLGFLRRNAVAVNEVVVTRVADLRCDATPLNANFDVRSIEVGWLAELSQRAEPLVINIEITETEASTDLFSAAQRFQQYCLSDTDENIHISIVLNDLQQNALLTLQQMKDNTSFKILDKNGIEMPYLSPITLPGEGSVIMSKTSACQTHAILIGINWYDNPLFPPLEGCVRDINNVEKLLRQRRPGLHVSKLTAAQPNEAKPPTYENVSSMMEEVKSQIRPNDFVYFHYSGHGGRQLRNSSDGHPIQGLNDDNYYEYLLLHGNRHLKNYELGYYLEGFSEAGANVFAVLDCCHAGGGDRGDVTGVRQVFCGLPHIPEEKIEHYGIEEAPKTPRNRNASPGETYWTKARNYTVLAACQRYQFARELPNRYNQTEGALTSAMVRSLNLLWQDDAPPTYQTLYDNICACINIDKGPSRRQNPIMYGDRKRVLFENKSFNHNWTAIVSRVERNRIHINIGSLHGVCIGQKYTIYPPGSMERDNPITTITIDSVNGDQASAKIEGATSLIHEGCPADLTSSKYAKSMHVIVQCTKLYEALQARTDAGVIFHQEIYNGTQEASYKICYTNHGYQIVDQCDHPLPHCPYYPQGTATADNILKFLKKLAHYNNVLNLKNDITELNGDFEFFERDNIRTVLDGDGICLLLKNLRAPQPQEMDKNNLHFSILNLTVDWNVEVVFPEQEEPNDVSPGKTSDECLFDLSIPEDLGLDAKTNTITDIFKVIVTDRPSYIISTIFSRVYFKEMRDYAKEDSDK
ncbi:hypothetical protein MKX08_003239 [Trichoderma sp. CBMAI-0020]|nr:hypothetical protein MKX08_003239 [Trichoderma sp. CBMAI-0020]